MFPVFWLNSIQRYAASRIVLVLAVSAFNLYTGMVNAQPYRTEFYLLVIAASLFVLFSNQKIISIVFLFIVFLFCIYVYNVYTALPGFFIFNVGLIIRIIIAFLSLFAILYLLLKEGKENQTSMDLKAQLLEAERNEVMRANFTKDRVLSVISHDLRSPINSLQGLLTLISNKQLSQTEFQSHTQKLSKQVNQLQLSIEELLSWSRSKSSPLTPQPELLSADQMVSSSIGGIKSLADEKKIDIKFNESQLKIYADQSMIRSVITNLLTNAIKFTPSLGQVTISTKALGTKMTCIMIHDNGVGIPKENLGNVFDGNYSTLGTINEKGTGIGLSLCKDFIERNQGTLNIESEVNKGTTCTITLPASSTHQPS